VVTRRAQVNAAAAVRGNKQRQAAASPLPCPISHWRASKFSRVVFQLGPLSGPVGIGCRESNLTEVTTITAPLYNPRRHTAIFLRNSSSVRKLLPLKNFSHRSFVMRADSFPKKILRKHLRNRRYSPLRYSFWLRR